MVAGRMTQCTGRKTESSSVGLDPNSIKLPKLVTICPLKAVAFGVYFLLLVV